MDRLRLVAERLAAGWPAVPRRRTGRCPSGAPRPGRDRPGRCLPGRPAVPEPGG